MTTKRISVSEEVYSLLERMRLPGERLDQTILRLCGIKARGTEFNATFEEALDDIAKEDAQLLRRLAK